VISGLLYFLYGAEFYREFLGYWNNNPQPVINKDAESQEVIKSYYSNQQCC
jgi:hypothetical protein